MHLPSRLLLCFQSSVPKKALFPRAYQHCAIRQVWLRWGYLTIPDSKAVPGHPSPGRPRSKEGDDDPATVLMSRHLVFSRSANKEKTAARRPIGSEDKMLFFSLSGKILISVVTIPVRPAAPSPSPAAPSPVPAVPAAPRLQQPVGPTLPLASSLVPP